MEAWMLVYFLSFFLSMFICWIGCHEININKKKICITFNKQGVVSLSEKRSNRFLIFLIASIPLILTAGLRYMVGTDYVGYLDIFNDAKRGRIDSEYLYTLINKAVVALDLDYHYVLLICGAVFCIPIFYQIDKDSPYPVLSVFLLFATRYYFAYLNIMRQLCACAILLVSLQYVEKRKLIPFLICVAIAFGFHTTSIIFLIVYWLPYQKITRIKAIYIAVIAALLKPFIARFVLIVMKATGYAHYFGGYYDTGQTKYFNLLIQGAVLLLALMYYKKGDYKYKIYTTLQLLTFTVMIYSGTLPLVERMRFYFMLPSIILIPLAVSKEKNKLNRLCILIGIILAFSAYLYLGILKDDYEVIPYQSILSI